MLIIKSASINSEKKSFSLLWTNSENSQRIPRSFKYPSTHETNNYFAQKKRKWSPSKTMSIHFIKLTWAHKVSS